MTPRTRLSPGAGPAGLQKAILQAKAVEAIQRLASVDKAVQRCLLAKWHFPQACEPAEDFTNMDMEDTFAYWFIVAHQESPGIIILIRKESNSVASMNVSSTANGCPYTISLGSYSPGTRLVGLCGFEPISTR